MKAMIFAAAEKKFRGERMMQEKTSNNLSRNQIRTGFDNSISLVAGGIACVLLGLLLLGVFDATGGSLAALKPLGLGLVFIPVTTLGFCANFMDKSRRNDSGVRDTSNKINGSQSL